MKLPEKQDSARAPAAPAGERAIELADLGVLRVRGSDAVRFLQGQLSNDVARLATEGSLLAGYHNPQGRAIAVLRLVQAAEGDILAVLPRELVATVLARLARFVLRAKVQLSDDSASWRIQGIVQVGAPGGLAVKVASDSVRWIVLTAQDPARGAAADAASESPSSIGLGSGSRGRSEPGSSGGSEHVSKAPIATERRAWTLLDIASGLPQVYSRTCEVFVAQMLNLDLLDGIAFSKGCYTGQEIIARAHYRGRVKRRMQRWRTLASAALAPGDSGELADGRSFRVVEAVQLPDGRCEFLAVTSPDAHSSPGSAPDGSTGPAESAGEPQEPARSPLAAESLPLPYALPSDVIA